MLELTASIIIAIGFVPAFMPSLRSVWIAVGGFVLASPLMLIAMVSAVKSATSTSYGQSMGHAIGAIAAGVVSVLVLIISAVGRTIYLKRKAKRLEN